MGFLKPNATAPTGAKGKTRKRGPKSVRVCISLPGELYETLCEGKEFNWSAVCAEALRREHGPKGS